MAATVLAGCLDTFTRPAPVGTPAARVEILYQDSALLVGHTLSLSARAWDSAGQLIGAPLLYWTSSDSQRLAVDQQGMLSARMGSGGADYTILVSALSSGVADTLLVHVAVPGEVKWRLSLGSMPTAGGPAQGPDGTLYTLGAVDITSSQATLFAINPNGSVAWQHRLAQVNGANYPLVATDGLVSVVGQFVYAYHPDGSLAWTVTNRPSESLPNLPDGHSASISSDGTLFASMAYDLFAFRASNGDTLWIGPRAPDAGWLLPPSLSADGKTVYIKHSGDTLYAFRWPGGTPAWGVADPTGRVSFGQGSAVGGQRVVITTAEQLQEVDSAGAPIGLGSNLGYGVSEPAIGADGLLYVQTPAQSHGLFAFNPANVFHWRAVGYNPNFSLYGGPALAAGRVLYVAAREAFYGLQLSDTGATILWKYPQSPDSLVFAGSPLIGANGTVYTFTSCDYGRENLPCSDELFAFWADLPPEPNSPWPMWRHDARRSGQADR